MRRYGPALLLIVSLVGSLAAAEFALRAFAPVGDPYWDWRTRASYIPSQFRPDFQWVSIAEKGLPGMSGRNLFTINSYGFRGGTLIMPKPAGEFRVFMIGGSTTECLYLDDKDAISAVLERELQKRVADGWTVRVFNAGKSGDRSDDHVAMLSQRIVHLQPDLIVVFAGVNDLRAMMGGFDYLHLRVQEELGASKLARLLVTDSQLGRRLYYLVERVRPRGQRETAEALPSNTNYRSLVAIRRDAPVAQQEIHVDVANYRRNLLTLVGIARAQESAIVFMTQQSTWNSTVDPAVDDWQWLRYINGFTYPAAAMDTALKEMNQATREVARQAGVPIYDLALSMPKSLEFFYDDVHFNVHGASVAGTELAVLIVRHPFGPWSRAGGAQGPLVPR